MPRNEPVNEPVNDPVLNDDVNELNEDVVTNDPLLKLTMLPDGPCIPCEPDGP